MTPTGGGDNILSVVGVTMRFGGLLALDGVTFDVAAGHITGLIGPNGAGKSTMFNCINGLLTPTSGSIRFMAQDITRLAADARARLGMARTFQHLETFRSMTVRENLMVAAEQAIGRPNLLQDLLDLPSRRRRERSAAARVDAVVNDVDLTPIADRVVHDLALGQERLVELGRALCTAPRLLLLDEPSSGLDQSESRRFGHLLQGLVEAHGITVLIVEHDMSLVMDICEDLHVLDFGKLIASGPASEVRDDPAVISAYLGADHTADATGLSDAV